jgi:hypothetical protein
MAETPKRQGRGCFFYGAITFVLVLIGVMLGVYFGARKAALAAIAKYTATAPVAIPTVNLPPAEQDRIARELARTAQQVRAGQGPSEIALGAQELNILLGQNKDVQTYRQQLYLQPEGDKLTAEMSVPLDQFELWKSFLGKIRAGDLTNRYLNGTAFMSLGVSNGTLFLNVTNLVVNGETLPKEFIDRIKDQNFAEQANSNPDLQAGLQRVKGVSVQNSQVVLQFNR